MGFPKALACVLDMVVSVACGLCTAHLRRQYVASFTGSRGSAGTAGLVWPNALDRVSAARQGSSGVACLISHGKTAYSFRPEMRLARHEVLVYVCSCLTNTTLTPRVVAFSVPYRPFYPHLQICSPQCN